MTLFLSRAVRVAAMTACASAFQPTHASAQAADTPTPPSRLTLSTTVPAGGVVLVTDIHGRTVTGVLGRVTSEAVEVTVEGGTRSVLAGRVQRIRWRQQDSWLPGVLIGAGIGAVPAVYYLVTDPNECTGPCPEEYALIGVGALAGGLVDWAIRKTITVYERPAARGGGGHVVVMPLLTGTRRGAQLTVSY
jgi:hypothetical protein